MLTRLVLALCATVLGAAGCRQGRPAGVQPARDQGGLATLEASDTSRPPIPRSTTFTYPRDTLYVVTNPADTGRIYYRRLYEIMFLNSASGSAIRALLAKYRASIVAGAPFTGSYIVMMPDPGATWQAVQARQDSLDHEPIVWVFTPLIRRDNPPVLRGLEITVAPGGTAKPAVPGNPELVVKPPWPPLIDRLPALDATHLVATTDSSLIYFRTDIVLRFKAGVPDSTKAAYFARNALQVLGVTQSGQFFVRMRDPGPSLPSFYSALDRLEADISVDVVAPIPAKPWPTI